MRQPGATPLVSFLIATHSRRDVLLHTLGRIQCCGLSHEDFETLVVDNASTDGTAGAVRAHFPSVIVLEQSRNHGPCAKNEALRLARGEFVVFLDDDSFPQPGSVARMIGHFRRDPSLGAAVFTITLPDGSRECSAYPDVCIGCGTGFRRSVLLEVGGLPADFFMAAEEYDLSLRLLNANWTVRNFDDLHVTHLKTPGARFPRRITRLDARNNTLLALRYFPRPWRQVYAAEWLLRYRMMAAAKGHQTAFWRGALAGWAMGIATRPQPVSENAFERFARLGQIRTEMNRVAGDMRLRDVLFVDYGKNMLAYRLAAEACGLRIVGIADQVLGGRGFRYRGIPIMTDSEARRLGFDAAVISNMSPVHAARRLKQWQSEMPNRPVVDLLQSPTSGTAAPHIMCA